MPFDRLVRAVDQWAIGHGREDVFAQIGPGAYLPSRIRWTRFLHPDEFRHQCQMASAIVAHAGTGSIIKALELGKPILVLPRRAGLRETRNEHQLATAEQFRRYPSVTVAWDEHELLARLDGIDVLNGRQAIGPAASRELLDAVREFIGDGEEGDGEEVPA
jgi:UDP-N-acetylglucosamine transferase subunit ALG13